MFEKKVLVILLITLITAQDSLAHIGDRSNQSWISRVFSWVHKNRPSSKTQPIPVARHGCDVVEHDGLVKLDTHLKRLIDVLNKKQYFQKCNVTGKGYTEVDLRIVSKKLKKELNKRHGAELELKTTQDLEKFLGKRPCIDKDFYLTFLEFVKIFHKFRDPLHAKFTTMDLYWLLVDITQNGRQWRKFAKRGTEPVTMSVDISRLNIKNKIAEKSAEKIAKIIFYPDGQMVLDLESMGLKQKQVGDGVFNNLKTGLAFDDRTFKKGKKLDVLPKQVVLTKPKMERDGTPRPGAVEEIENEAAIVKQIKKRSAGKPVKGIIESSILREGANGEQKTILRPFMARGVLNRKIFEKKDCEGQMRMLVWAAAGMVNLHRLGIVHLDIKGDNILLDKYGRAVLSDFGTASDLKTMAINIKAGKRVVIGGTRAYLPPEISHHFKDWLGKLKLKSRKEIRRDIKSIDVYAFGKLLGPVGLDWKGVGCKESVPGRITKLIEDATMTNPTERISDIDLLTRLQQINQ